MDPSKRICEPQPNKNPSVNITNDVDNMPDPFEFTQGNADFWNYDCISSWEKGLIFKYWEMFRVDEKLPWRIDTKQWYQWDKM